MRYGRFASSARERREADLFLADLLGYAAPAGYGEEQPQSPPPKICGFFRPDNTARTMAQLRTAIVAQCNTEWSAWHFSGGVPKPECDASVFGRLIGYYLAAERTVLSDDLTTVRTNAVSINYGPILGPAAPTSAQILAIRKLLLAGAPGTSASGVINDARSRAREGHDNLGSFRAWSAVFVSACVRGAAIAEGIEGVKLPGRTPEGLDRPLRPSIRHIDYVNRAFDDLAAGNTGRYHPFEPSKRSPQPADIIVLDRRDNIGPGGVRPFAKVPAGVETHGDIVVEVVPDSVVTIGGNVADGVRKRRYPRDMTTGRLLTVVPRLYAQEDDAGALSPTPGVSCQALPDKSTARIFALLSLVEECRTPPPAGGGSGSGSGGGSGAGSGSGR